jgi:hypothetical protein
MNEKVNFDAKLIAHMAVCEGLAIGSLFLSKYSDFEMSRKEHQAMLTDFSPRVYRVHLIAGPATLNALMKLQEFLIPKAFELEAERTLISMQLIDVRKIEAVILHLRNVEEQASGQIAGLAKTAQDPTEDVRSKIAALEAQQKNLEQNIFRMQMDFGGKAFHAAMEFENLGTEVIVAMRQELDISLDAAAYASSQRQLRQKAEKLCNSFIASLKETVLPQESR